MRFFFLGRCLGMKALNIKDIVVNYRIYFGRSQINCSHPTIELLIIKKGEKNTIYKKRKKKKRVKLEVSLLQQIKI